MGIARRPCPERDFQRQKVLNPFRCQRIRVESKVDFGGYSISFRDPDGDLLAPITPTCWSIF
jgi:hypothetical protein